MGTFNGFKKQDLEFFDNMPSEDMTPEHHISFYQKNKDTARNIDQEFGSLFKDIDIFLRINFKSKYEWKAKRLSQGFGKRFKYVWGAFYTSKRIRHQEDIQLFVNFGKFEDKEAPTFNLGISLLNIEDDDRYNLYKNNLKLNSKEIKSIIEKSENKYAFEDDEDRQISGEIEEIFAQWSESPGSIWKSFNEKEILETKNFIEKIKSIMRDLYPIFDLLIRKEKSV